MNPEYDGDIKIYSGKPSPDISEFDRLIENIDFNRSNGNEEKAAQLGRIFAALKPTDECLEIVFPKMAGTASILYQARVLITFLCGETAKDIIADKFLADIVQNSIYEQLKQTEYGYYKNIADGAAFSFYRVALQKKGSPEEIIGKEFAKLCGSSKTAEIIDLGKMIYKNTVEYSRKLTEKAKFMY